MSTKVRNLLLIVILLLGQGGVTAQLKASHHDLFAPIPERLRCRLSERLEALVDYERKQQWDMEYDLLSPYVTQGESKVEFVKRLTSANARLGSYRVLDFTPKYTAAVYEGRWEVFGCAKVFRQGRTRKLNAEVTAILENGEWFLSQVSFDREPCTR